MQSDVLRTRTIEILKTSKRPDLWENPGRLSAWRKALHIPSPLEESGGEKSGAALPPVSVQIRMLPNTRIVDLICDSPNPVFAAEFANTLTDEYIRRSLEARSTGSDRTKAWLA